MLVGLTSLAAGTDQIFANCVLDVGGELTAIIPVKGYRAFFKGEALSSYDRLVMASKLIELRSTKPNEQAFLDAGKWIVKNSDTMIAVWDGEPAEGAGGTADVVRYAQSLGKSVHCLDPIRRVALDI